MAANPDETPRVVIDAAQLLADLPPRVARIETHIEYLRGSLGDLKVEMSDLRAELKADAAALRSEARTDFRLTFAALIAVALGLAGMMAKGFHWL